VHPQQQHVARKLDARSGLDTDERESDGEGRGGSGEPARSHERARNLLAGVQASEL
jgi:hypothetical protein